MVCRRTVKYKERHDFGRLSSTNHERYRTRVQISCQEVLAWVILGLVPDTRFFTVTGFTFLTHSYHHMLHTLSRQASLMHHVGVLIRDPLRSSGAEAQRTALFFTQQDSSKKHLW